MLEILNFGHITSLPIKFESRDKILQVMLWIEIMTSSKLQSHSLKQPKKI